MSDECDIFGTISEGKFIRKDKIHNIFGKWCSVGSNRNVLVVYLPNDIH